jgi:transketolase|tara:strand:+ start:3534 stop:4511 length:978 start_codon:yes stop_codon:yes gene_type:complete
MSKDSKMSKDIRDAFFDEICSFAMKDKDVIVLTDDFDVFSLRKLKEERPDQFINVGVAEQNMIAVAAGLASMGKKVFVFGISSFVLFRCYEQIKFLICSMNLPVKIVGIGSGLSFGFDGPTHHGVQDIAVARTLPEMRIYNPSDSLLAANCAIEVMKTNEPCYIRIDKGILPDVYSWLRSDMCWQGFLRAGMPPRSTRPRNVKIIISTGKFVCMAKEIAIEADVDVIDIYRIKPLADELADELRQYENIYVLEEHCLTGGLGSAILEFCSDHKINIPIQRIAIPDEHCFKYASRDWLLEDYQLTKDQIRNEVSANRSGTGAVSVG